MDSLGTRLKSLRKERKLTQSAVGAAVGVSRSFVAGLETGQDHPGRETLMALANFYDVSVDWLASGNGPMRAGEATAKNETEALWLWAFRNLPPEEAQAHLNLILRRIKPRSS